jgi:hypothetical protein
MNLKEHVRDCPGRDGERALKAALTISKVLLKAVS